MRRRDFIKAIGGASAAWPLSARALQSMPVIGSLHAASLKGFDRHMDAFRQGLREVGYVEGQNVLIEYHWAEGAFDRLPAMMMTDLVRARVAVIVAWGTAARTVKNAHAAGIGSNIPVVFAFAGDPVAIGLVSSFNRPGASSGRSTPAPNAIGMVAVAARCGPDGPRISAPQDPISRIADSCFYCLSLIATIS